MNCKSWYSSFRLTLLLDCVKIPGAVVVFQHSFHATTSACFIASINYLRVARASCSAAAAVLHSSHKQSLEIQFTLPPALRPSWTSTGAVLRKNYFIIFLLIWAAVVHDQDPPIDRQSRSNIRSLPLRLWILLVRMRAPSGTYACVATFI